jgi:hypothetical protein
MKLKLLACVTAITLLAALALPTQCVAQEHKHKLPHYTVVDPEPVPAPEPEPEQVPVAQ